MRLIILICFTTFCSNYSFAQLTPFEKKGKNYTATYNECIDYYKLLAQQNGAIKVMEMGQTDNGKPLHLVLLNASNNFYPSDWKQNKQCVLLINNGIHPGEPDGIDASMMLARDICAQIKKGIFPKNISIAIIPVYNIGGMLLRSNTSRPDQNGPDAFGARGNAQNLDLNRDFIKCDSKEAQAFTQIFHFVEPTIFIDNHVSDGADYPYTMTLATTQKDKLGGILGNYLHTQIEPAIYKMMEKKNNAMIPYVNVWGWDARKGWNQFFDSPRYSSGYATLFNTLAFVPETHMLKPYANRVQATYDLMQCFINYASTNCNTLWQLKNDAIEAMVRQRNFPISWKNDKTKADTTLYNGYTYDSVKSKVSGLMVPHYNRQKIYTAKVPFYNNYITTDSVQAPIAYIIPFHNYKVIELLQNNGIEMQNFEQDSIMLVEQYTIVDYKSSTTPYEGHHANKDVKVQASVQKIFIPKGSYYAATYQVGKRFLIETLEPHAMDSYFSWNFFDAFLTQKEGFTSYAFEELAASVLQKNDSLKTALNQKVIADTAFAKDAEAQLKFVYDAIYHEPRHNVYPIYRVVRKNKNDFSVQGTNEQELNKKDE